VYRQAGYILLDRRAGYSPLCFCTVFVNARRPDCLASSQPGTGRERMPVQEPVQYRNNGPSSVPEWSSAQLSCQMPEFRCRRHQPLCDVQLREFSPWSPFPNLLHGEYPVGRVGHCHPADSGERRCLSGQYDQF
jgi:hypothetical protein